MGGLRPHLSYANVTATLALFLALGGATAFAIEKPPRKSVGAPELRPGAVTANKLRKNAVVTPKIAAKAVTTPKIASDAVDGRVIAAGSVSTDKIAFGAITHDKVGLDAITGDQIVESSLTQVPSAGFADSATNAESANPLAFAEVDGGGGLNPNRSKGLSPADVVKTSTGTYCITASFIPRGAQATPENEEASQGRVTAYVTISGTGTCPQPRVEVQTYNSGIGNVDSRFYVMLYR
jgi:hypothetical protein